MPRLPPLVLAALLLGCGVPPSVRGGTRERTALVQAVAGVGDGVRVTLVQVDYAPGASSPPHAHGCPVVGYVESGAVRSQLAGERPVVYHAGDAFYEAAGVPHLVSANADPTKPARFLAWFICPRGVDER